MPRRTDDAKRVVFATDAAFLPPYQGDAARLGQLISGFRCRGWEVHVVHFHDAGQRDVDYDAMRRSVDRLVVYRPSAEDLARRASDRVDDWCPNAFADLVRDTCEAARADCVIAQFVFLSRCLDAVGPSRRVCRVLDADNVFTDRRAVHAAAGVAYSWFSTSADEERKGWRRADVLMAIQERERAAILAQVPDRPVILAPQTQPVIDCGPGDGRTMLFVGADNETNAKGLRDFIDGALPGIRRAHPGARLVLAGRCGERFRGVAGVDVLGAVDDLRPWYTQAALVLNMAPCGTGLKTKTVEAISHGKCLVSTASGVQGLEDYAGIYRLVSTSVEAGSAISSLLGRPAEIERLRIAALQFARRYFSPDAVFDALETAILQHHEYNRQPS